ncbi:iron(III) transport system permease protein [Nocardiopsis sp. Huas11]|uniref:ABC transporter permease n=1 Tax=Nocardiopsis sp. Huas11 TaxID=2183912 RepID=UPI000EB30BD9|nr:iron ABC transporter permease [Nocardiopsis sp. Huas11]RKS06529.1 iron(III) transport system permease protein [Nocardiopsis sp. Huas11]
MTRVHHGRTAPEPSHTGSGAGAGASQGAGTRDRARPGGRLGRLAGPLRRRLPLALPLYLLAGATGALAVLPLGYVVFQALSAGPAALAENLLRARTLQLLGNSLGLTATVTLASLVVGTALALLVTRVRLPGGRVWGLVATLPLAIPSYVAAMVWMEALPQFRGFAGSAIVLTLCCYPYVFLPVAAALGRSDRDQEEIARSLGSGPVHVLLRVTLRHVQPSATAGALLVALYVLSDFGSVATMRYDTFTRVIYNDFRNRFDLASAASLSLVLVAVTLLVLWGEARARGRARFSRLGSGSTRRRPPLDPAGHLAGNRPPAVAALVRGVVGALLVLPFVAVAAAALVFPVAMLAYWIVRGSSAGLDPQRMAETALTTLGLSALAAVVTLVLALPVGILAARHRGRVPRLLEGATWTGYSMPGVVVAVALVYFAVTYAHPLYQQAPLLVLAYALLFLPAAVGSVRSAVAQSAPALEEVGRSLGHGAPQVFGRVTLPLAFPGLAAGATLVFLACMKELPVTLMLHPTGTETIAMRLWSATNVGRFAAAAPYAMMLIVLASVPAFVLGRWAGERRDEP